MSRVSHNKYGGTTRGAYEIKFIFSSGLSIGARGEVRDSEAVRHQIHNLIDGEPRD